MKVDTYTENLLKIQLCQKNSTDGNSLFQIIIIRFL